MRWSPHIACVSVLQLLSPEAATAQARYEFGFSLNPTAQGELAALFIYTVQDGVVLGTMAFAGIGLTLAGRLRGELNLGAQNGIYLVLLLVGGMVIPFDELPSVLRAVAFVLPSGALADVLRDALTGGGERPGASWIVLAAWALAAPLVARRLFRFD